uniref:AAA+ ATPase domain-containing protein n=1 Tax=Oryza punctata TaxID=4537 RepID=A0A0E0MGR0_ORYPU
MEFILGEIRPLLIKLGKLLKEEYGLEKEVRRSIESLQNELMVIHAALNKVDRVPRDQLDDEVRVWAGKLRELSYNMEDAIDAFMVRMEKGPEPAAENNLNNKVKKFLEKTVRLFTKSKDLHQISHAIEEAQELAKQCADLRQRYMFDFSTVKGGATLDPRVLALMQESSLASNTRDKIIEKLFNGDEESKLQLRKISIVGFAGLGKTTLAKAVHEKIKSPFDCNAFVSVSQTPDITRIFKKTLYGLDQQKFANINEATRDEVQLIDELRNFLKDKRYLIIVDDIWQKSIWERINCALVDSNCGSRVITTTRIHNVAEEVGDVYRIEKLSDENSKRLFDKRVFGTECKSVSSNQSEEVTKKILKKCDGVPLSIITIASVLVHKEDWSEVYDSVGFGPEDGNEVVHNTMKILSFSYYDLPSYLQRCLLYLSIYPEDDSIEKDCLIWKWIAEGFVYEKQGKQLFEVGETYFNELINRSMVQPIEDQDGLGIVEGCHIHDTMLYLIRNLSKEVDFVKILDRACEDDYCLQSTTIHRIAVHHGMKQDQNNNISLGMAQLRSLNAMGCKVSMMPPFESLQALRVLAIEYCDVSTRGCQLKHLGKLCQLRYLGLRGTPVVELPREIGDLVHLQTLDVRDTGLEALPATVGKLSKLMRLWTDEDTRLPFGVGNMKSLQELSVLTLTEDCCPNFTVELCKLTNLRVCIFYSRNINSSSLKTLVESFCSLRRIQHLQLGVYSHQAGITSLEGWEPPLQLRFFRICGVPIARLPAWDNCKHLSELCFHVLELETRDLDILANMPELRELAIYIVGRFSWTIAGGGLFPSLRSFVTNITVTFLEGAMPLLTKIDLKLQVSMDDAVKNVGLGNLLQLNSVHIDLKCRGATTREVEEAEVVAGRMVDGHPNCPCIGVYKSEQDLMKEDEDDGDDMEISDPDEAESDDDEEEISDTDQEPDCGMRKGRKMMRTSSPQTLSSDVQHLRNEDEDDEENISASEVDGNDHDEEISATDQEPPLWLYEEFQKQRLFDVKQW